MSDDNNAVVMEGGGAGEMTVSAHAAPLDRNATAKGASTSISAAGTIPVMTRLISAYNDAHTPRDPMIPIGRSRPGSGLLGARRGRCRTRRRRRRRQTRRRERRRGREARTGPVIRVHVQSPRDDDETDDREGDGGDDGVESRRLSRAEDEKRGDEHDERGGGEVEADASVREVDAEGVGGRVEEGGDVAGPSARDGGGGDGEFEGEVAAAEEAGELAEGLGDVVVGGPGDGGLDGELGVAQTGDHGGEAGDDVREHHRGAGVVVRGGAGEDEHAAAHHAAHAEEEEVERPENLLHRQVRRGLRLGGGLERTARAARRAAAARTLTGTGRLHAARGIPPETAPRRPAVPKRPTTTVPTRASGRCDEMRSARCALTIVDAISHVGFAADVVLSIKSRKLALVACSAARASLVHLPPPAARQIGGSSNPATRVIAQPSLERVLSSLLRFGACSRSTFSLYASGSMRVACGYISS